MLHKGRVTMLQLTNSASIEVLEQLLEAYKPKQNKRIISIANTEIIIPGGTAYNLLNAFTLPEHLLINEEGLNYDYSGNGIDQVVHFPYVADKVRISVKLRLTGIIDSATAYRMWGYQLIRGGETTPFEEKSGFKFAPLWSINRNTIDFESNMRGANDPFITQGVKMLLNNTEDRTITVRGIEITTVLYY